MEYSGLFYTNYGLRLYGENPLYPYRRSRWEFQVVTSGSCKLLLDGGGERKLLSGSLCVFPAEYAHGWGGERGESCEIVVFHFDSLPNPIMSSLNLSSVPYSITELSEQDCMDLTQLAQHTRRMMRSGGNRLILSQRVLWTLGSYLDKPNVTVTKRRSSRHQISDGVAWFREHLHLGVGVAETADALGMSLAHFRRLFTEEARQSPQVYFSELRMQRAMQLMEETELSLESIGIAVGYSCGAAFSRAFKLSQDTSAAAWRRRRRT